MKTSNAIARVPKPLKTILLAVALLVSISAARAQIFMDGDVWFSLTGSRIRVYIEELENFNDATTERLRLRVWASENHWHEDDRGKLLGSTTLPRLAANRHRHDVYRSMKLHRPDTDWYYVTITLEERTFDEFGQVQWEIRDWLESDDRIFIRDTWFPLWPWD